MQRKISQDRIYAARRCDQGLTVLEVESRRSRYGRNTIVGIGVNRWRELAQETIKDPMIWFLIGTGVLFALLKNYNQAIILFLATIPLLVMDAFLHWRTQVSTRSLSNQLAAFTQVIRNNHEISIAAEEIVPGDLLVINAGMSFPADGIIVAGKDLQVDESALTGESFPVNKLAFANRVQDASEFYVEDRFWGFAGTRLLTGHALLRVAYTGQETLYGEIVTSALYGTHDRTPLQKVIGKLVFYLIGVAIIACIILALVRIYQGFGILDAILSAATLAVAALPDEFPVVFTFFLGLGVYRLARKKALVRRAVSVENIGRVTCICSDKTGTITEGRFQLTRYESRLGVDKNYLLYLATIASRAETQDPLDLAIFDAANRVGLEIPQRLLTFPFTEDRKRETSIVIQDAEHFLVASKGSPELILSLCNLTDQEKQLWLEKIADFASEGYKVIACAEYVTTNTAAYIEPEENYQFAGLLLFSDPPRLAVAEAVQHCLQSGIHVLMITGDHPETARAIANLIGLGKGKPNVILAQDAEIYCQNNDNFLKTVDVIARAIPSQKLSFVTSLQSSGEIVAVTGDGVNDVPALKKADIGIAMGEHGTQSAREVADIVLLDDNFTSIVNAIAEGRQLFKNLLASYKYLLMIHMPFVISAALIPLMGYPLLYYPIHIVWIELIIHPTSMLVFQDLPASKKLTPVERQRKIRFFSAKDLRGILTVGFFTTVFVIISYMILFSSDKNIALARGFILASLSFISAGITIGLTNLSTRVSRLIVISTLIFAILFVQIPVMSAFLNFTPLSIYQWLIIALAGGITVLLCKI